MALKKKQEELSRKQNQWRYQNENRDSEADHTSFKVRTVYFKRSICNFMKMLSNIFVDVNKITEQTNHGT